MNKTFTKTIIRKAAAAVVSLGLVAASFVTYIDETSARTYAAENTSNQTQVPIIGLVDANNKSIAGSDSFDYDNRSFKILIPSGLKLKSNADLARIQILANGQDETYKFEAPRYLGVDASGNMIYLVKLKDTKLESPTNTTKEDYLFKLRESTLYNVYIPEGIFEYKNPVRDYEGFTISFATMAVKEKASYPGIIKSISPDKNETADSSKGRIEIEFADDIEFAAGAQVVDSKLKNAGEYIQLTSAPLKSNPKVPQSYYIEIPQKPSDSIDNFNVYISGSKLVIESQKGKLKDFAKYTVRLKDGLVRLKRSAHNSSGIVNKSGNILGWFTYSFETGGMLKASYPFNNQEGVEVEPTITLIFKHQIERKDSTAKLSSIITLKEDDSQKIEIADSDISLSSNSIEIRIRDNGTTKHRLRRNTLYTLAVTEGSLQFTDYKSYTNEQIKISFITRGEGENPSVLGYSSKEYQGYDDITSLQGSRLQPDGSIYIHLDRDVRKDKDYSKYASQIKLWRVAKADEKAYDSDGILRDKRFEYALSGNQMNGTAGMLEEIPIESIKVGQESGYPNIIKITPKSLSAHGKNDILTPLHMYKIAIPQDAVEDTNGYNLKADISEYIWTGPLEDRTQKDLKWDVSGITASEIAAVENAPYKSYRLYGTPAYSPKGPIVLYIDGKVHVDQSEYELLGSNTAIRYKSLENIGIAGTYSNTENLRVERVKVEYETKNEGEVTKLSIYPSSMLLNGKGYVLSVPRGVFISPTGQKLERLEVGFTVGGDKTREKGIYGISPSSIDLYDILSGAAEFNISGYNFHEDIEYIELTKPGVKLRIGPSDIEFRSVESIRFKMTEAARATVAADPSKYKGDYGISIKFKNENNPTVLNNSAGQGLSITASSWMKVIRTYPSVYGFFDEKSLGHTLQDATTKGKSFIRLEFNEALGDVELSDNWAEKLLASSMKATGSQVNLLDDEFISAISSMGADEKRQAREKYIFVEDKEGKKSTLYIPVKDLMPNTEYQFTLAKGVVTNAAEPNEVYTWTWKSQGEPAVSGVQTGTVEEGYGSGEYIIINGSFGSSPSVYFERGSKSEKAPSVDVSSDGKSLKVTLPKNGDRLKPGVYDIRVSYDSNHETLLPLALTIAKSTALRVNPQEVTVSKDSKGDIIQSTVKSESKVVLKPKNSSGSSLKLDMDKLLGNPGAMSKVEFDGDKGDSLSKLEVKMPGIEAAISGCTLAGDSDDYDTYIALGEAEAVLADAVKSKLYHKTTKSAFVQIRPQGIIISSVELTLPYSGSYGTNLEILRYDFDTRQLEKINSFNVNKSSSTVWLKSYKPGIFVVVEK